MWENGTVKVFGCNFTYSAKRYDTPSKMGIFNGCVSKLDLFRGGKYVAHYDRGWDMSPMEMILIDPKKIVSTPPPSQRLSAPVRSLQAVPRGDTQTIMQWMPPMTFTKAILIFRHSHKTFTSSPTAGASGGTTRRGARSSQLATHSTIKRFRWRSDRPARDGGKTA